MGFMDINDIKDMYSYWDDGWWDEYTVQLNINSDITV